MRILVIAVSVVLFDERTFRRDLIVVAFNIDVATI